ncbi:tyrosine--tRNA ligase [Thioflexithrix psekupsensis]|uniref:Tyrosine--tRNA ligase n=1 Tax=Thioflexithrix psekupsensis TaxID=1570016 RepID=A0A251XAN9_9GAMM|nr:tyrosine--tRNA ligase [Thioflexithrix psekupsensis]OUD15041.1 tyrosine--tRNA ligase [Thioflexithrix psekupsensis]
MSNLLLNELNARQLIAQLSADAELKQHLSDGCRTLYAGFDPTADSLHIGHLVPLLVLRRFQLAGHQPIALIGGATGLIGDPSFKATERQLNTAETVTHWVEQLSQQLAQFLDFNCGQQSAKIVNNMDWTRSLDVLSFLRDIGKHFSINAMIQKESVKQRIEREGSGISFTEFSYMILQSYDFAMLNRHYHCTLQIGGSDQWGNITGGIDLTRRLNQQTVYGLTVPLVTKADGTKFGKTETGTIWLSSAKTSPYRFYQFWLNTADADVYKFLRYFTFLPPAQIDEIEAADRQATGRREAQSVLAREMTRFIHGEVALHSAERITEALFTDQVQTLNAEELRQLKLDGMPSTELNQSQIALVDLIALTGLAKSKTQAREFITKNAISVNGEKISDLNAMIEANKGFFGRYFIVRRGKKEFHLVDCI